MQWQDGTLNARIDRLSAQRLALLHSLERTNDSITAAGEHKFDAVFTILIMYMCQHNAASRVDKRNVTTLHNYHLYIAHVIVLYDNIIFCILDQSRFAIVVAVRLVFWLHVFLSTAQTNCFADSITTSFRGSFSVNNFNVGNAVSLFVSQPLASVELRKGNSAGKQLFLEVNHRCKVDRWIEAEDGRSLQQRHMIVVARVEEQKVIGIQCKLRRLWILKQNKKVLNGNSTCYQMQACVITATQNWPHGPCDHRLYNAILQNWID